MGKKCQKWKWEKHDIFCHHDQSRYHLFPVREKRRDRNVHLLLIRSQVLSSSLTAGKEWPDSFKIKLRDVSQGFWHPFQKKKQKKKHHLQDLFIPSTKESRWLNCAAVRASIWGFFLPAYKVLQSLHESFITDSPVVSTISNKCLKSLEILRFFWSEEVS